MGDARGILIIAAKLVAVIVISWFFSPGAGAALASLLFTTGIDFAANELFPVRAAPPNLESFSAFSANRTQMVRQAITERRMLIGEARVSGPMTFYESSENNRFHHYIVALGDGEFDKIGTVWVGDEPVFDEQIDAGGNVTAGRFSGKLRIKKHLGGPSQAADPDIIAELAGLDANFKGANTPYIYVRVDWNRDTYPGGLPSIAAFCRGSKFLDPRDSVTRWTPNAVLATRGYMTDTRLGHKVPSTRINDTFTSAAANVCDETVDTVGVEHDVTAVDASADTLALDGETLKYQTGDRVRLTTDGAAAGGLAVLTDYYVIVVNEASNDSVAIKVKLAATYAGALTDTGIDITDAGTGAHKLNKTGEPRYTASGVISSASEPNKIISDMQTAFAGRVAFSGIKYRIIAGAARTATLELDEDDFLQPIDVATRVSRANRFNAVKGIYVSPLNQGVASDYPAITNATWQANDGGEREFANADAPFTPRAATAQRNGKIALERHRREITFRSVAGLRVLEMQAGDWFKVSNTRRGWVLKEFELISFELTFIDGDNGSKFMAVAIEAKEIDAAAFNFDPLTEEVVPNPSPRTLLPKASDVAQPGAPAVVEVVEPTRDGAGVKARVTLTWTGAADLLVVDYKPLFRVTGSADWLPFAPATDLLTATAVDVKPGTYDFGVKAVNFLGVGSLVSETLGVEIKGLLAIPADPTGLTAQRAGGLMVLRWTQSPDLDVRIGGFALIRHDEAESGASLNTSVTVGDPVPGAATEALTPFKPGTYFVQFMDSSLQKSTGAASVSSKDAALTAFSTVGTVSEHPTFPGTHSGTVVESSALKLASGFDGIADVDAEADFDAIVGGVGAAGTYGFSAVLDMTTVQKVRLRTNLVVAGENPTDLIDDRTALIDTWADIDGATNADVDAQIWVRETNDDPAGSPTWSAFQQLHAGEYEARAFDAEARLSSADETFNIGVSTLGLTAEKVV